MLSAMIMCSVAGTPVPPSTEYRVKTLDGGTFSDDGWTSSGTYQEGYSIDGRVCLTTGFGIGPVAVSEKVYASDFVNAEIRLIGTRTNLACSWRAAIKNFPTSSHSVEIIVTGVPGALHFTIQTLVDGTLVHSHDEPCGVVDWLGYASIVKTGNSYSIKVNGNTVHSFSKSDAMNHYRVEIIGDPDFRAIIDDIGYLAPL